MSTRNTRRGPGHRPNVTPIQHTQLLSAVVVSITSAGGFTDIVLKLLSELAYAIDTDSGLVAQQVILLSVQDGDYQPQACIRIRDQGPASGGRLVEFRFNLETDTAAPWELQIPVNYPQLGTQNGARLAGTFGVGQANPGATVGWVKVSSLWSVPFPVPRFEFVTGMILQVDTHKVKFFGNVGTGNWTATTLPDFTVNGSNHSTVFTPNGNGEFTVTFTGVVTVGQTISYPVSLPSLTNDSTGFQLAPFAWPLT